MRNRSFAGVAAAALAGLLAAAGVRADPGFERLVPRGALVEPLAGAFSFVEGPLWVAARQELLFSDIPADRIVRWAAWPAGRTLGTWRSPSGQSNGLTLDRRGRLVACEHAARRVSVTGPDGRVATLADRVGGKRLNSPNDAVVRADGAVYFTDPPYGVDAAARDLDFAGVYRVPPKGGAPALLTKEFRTPNGLAFSPDEKTLYINDTEGGVIRAFPVAADGSLGKGGAFAAVKNPDGMKVDVEGNVWCTSAEGVEVFDPAGKRLGVVRFPEQPANCAFGEKDLKTLFVTARTGLYRVRVGVAGMAVGPR